MSKLKKRVSVVAYPTYPIVFVSSVKLRIPLHDTMGLAATDLDDTVKIVTTVERIDGDEITFTVNGESLPVERLESVKSVIDKFRELAGVTEKFGFKITSTNEKVFSGSSDAGAAAFVKAMDEMFGTNLSTDQLCSISMMISESGIRAILGGFNEMVVSGHDMIVGDQPVMMGGVPATAENLTGIRIFALGFNYESRVSAEQIFHATRSHPEYEMRLKRIPIWIANIKQALLAGNWNKLFWNAEMNCANAHYLIETSDHDLWCRKKEMLEACADIRAIRDTGLPAYWTAGGGTVIMCFSWGPEAEKVKDELIARGYGDVLVEYKVAPGATVLESE